MLFRLCDIDEFIPELQLILNEENILKVGIEPIDDGKKLCEDYEYTVRGTFDLRYLAVEAKLQGESLAKMAKKVLDIDMPKDKSVRASDWEADELSQVQKEYAALDAIAALELFRGLIRKMKVVHSTVDAAKLCQQIKSYSDVRWE